MKMKITLKSAAASTGVSRRMLASISLRIGTWPEYRDRIAKEISEHGADCGWSGFIYYAETEAFYRAHRAEILRMLRESADEIGQTPAEMISSFRCLAGVSRDEVAAVLAGGRSEFRSTVQNALAWFALEEVSRRIADMDGE